MEVQVRAQELVVAYIEDVWNSGNLSALEELTTSSFTYHLGGQPPRDVTGMKQFLTATREAFPDWRVQIDSIVGDELLVAVRWSGEVTHLGPFHGAPPTGKRVSVSGMNFYRLEEGKIAEEWEQMDSLGMLSEMGLFPPNK